MSLIKNIDNCNNLPINKIKSIADKLDYDIKEKINKNNKRKTQT